MKKKERKVLRGKLLTAIKKVLKDNKDDLKNKTEKAILKSIKQIAKKTDKKKKVASKKTNNNKIPPLFVIHKQFFNENKSRRAKKSCEFLSQNPTEYRNNSLKFTHHLKTSLS